MKTVYDMNGYRLHLIPSKKFKDITIHVNFKAPLEAKKNGVRSVLAFILSSATKKYPTSSSLASYLDELYGANVSGNISSKGQSHIISIRSTAVNQEFLPTDDNLLEKQLELLNEVIFNPSMTDGVFDERIVNIKKNEILARIQQGIDDKMSYSIDQLYHFMGKDTKLELSSTGKKEDIMNITNEDLYNAYIDMIENDDKHIYVVGDIDESVVEAFKEKLNFNDAKKNYPVIYDFTSNKKEVLEIIEKQDIVQAKLNIGYTLDTDFLSEAAEAMSIFADMLGGYSQSRLFQNVREKNSLCYYISASYDPFNSMMLIVSGIEAENYTKVRELVAEQMDAFVAGDFSDEEMEMAKMMVVSSLTKAYDSPSYLISLAYNRDLVNKKQSIEDYINKINAVSREDVIRCAKQVKLDTVYLLTGKDPYGKEVL